MILGCHKPCTISPFTSQKEAREEAGVAVAVHQEDVARHEDGVAEEASEVIAVVEALEVIAVAEALGAAGAQEGSAVVVAVAVDSGEVVVVSEGHDMCFKHV